MVSAGNTGALTAMAHFVLKTVGPVERAPIMSSVPARNGGHTHMLDLGANSKATALQLAQFATMGSIVARDVFGLANPRIGLLNIGEEETKGHELVQEAHELIRASGVNYLGFVEGNNIFDGSVDVVVTDGFTGNVALKTMEGLAKLIVEQMRTEFSRDALSKLSGLLAAPGAAPRGRRARSAPLQRRLHGRTDRSRGKKPRQRRPCRIRAGNRDGRHRDAARVAGGHRQGVWRNAPSPDKAA